MSGLREALRLQEDAAWPSNEALHTEEARKYFLRLVSPEALANKPWDKILPPDCFHFPAYGMVEKGLASAKH